MGARGGHQLVIVRAGKLTGRVPEQPPLHLDKPRPAALPSEKTKQAVEGGQCRIDCGGGTVLRQQPFLPAGHDLLGNGFPIQPEGKSPHISQILFQRGRGPFLLLQIADIGRDLFRCQFKFTHLAASFHKV